MGQDFDPTYIDPPPLKQRIEVTESALKMTDLATNIYHGGPSSQQNLTLAAPTTNLAPYLTVVVEGNGALSAITLLTNEDDAPTILMEAASELDEHFRQQKYIRAITSINKRIATYPQYRAKLLALRSELFQILKRTDLEAIDLNEATYLSPNDPFVAQARSECFMLYRDYQHAWVDVNGHISLDPFAPVFSRYRAASWPTLGHAAEMNQELCRAEVLQPQKAARTQASILMPAIEPVALEKGIQLLPVIQLSVPQSTSDVFRSQEGRLRKELESENARTAGLPLTRPEMPRIGIFDFADVSAR